MVGFRPHGLGRSLELQATWESLPGVAAGQLTQGDSYLQLKASRFTYIYLRTAVFGPTSVDLARHHLASMDVKQEALLLTGD